jgi:hypothetical protein
MSVIFEFFVTIINEHEIFFTLFVEKIYFDKLSCILIDFDFKTWVGPPMQCENLRKNSHTP